MFTSNKIAHKTCIFTWVQVSVSNPTTINRSRFFFHILMYTISYNRSERHIVPDLAREGEPEIELSYYLLSSSIKCCFSLPVFKATWFWLPKQIQEPSRPTNTDGNFPYVLHPLKFPIEFTPRPLRNAFGCILPPWYPSQPSASPRKRDFPQSHHSFSTNSWTLLNYTMVDLLVVAYSTPTLP